MQTVNPYLGLRCLPMTYQCLDVLDSAKSSDLSRFLLLLNGRRSNLQSALVISTSIISNNRLFRRENLVLLLTFYLIPGNKILWMRAGPRSAIGRAPD